MAARLVAGHEERFRVDGSECMLLERLEGDAEDKGPRRFKAIAYTGKDVGRVFGRMVVSSSGIQRGDTTGMLLEHDDNVGVAVADTCECGDSGVYKLEGYFLSDLASGGESGKLIAKADEGFPLKLSIGIRFLKHHFIEEGQSEEINGQTFNGPMVVVDECHLFECSFIHVNPADLDTEASVMRARAGETMGDEAEDDETTTVPVPGATTLGGADELATLRLENARLRGRSELRTRLKAEIPGRAFKRLRIQALAEGWTFEHAQGKALEIAMADRIKAKKKAAALAKLSTRSPHTGLGFRGNRGGVDDGGGTSAGKLESRFNGLTLEERFAASCDEAPPLAELWGEESASSFAAYLKTHKRSSTSGKNLITGDATTALSLDAMARGMRQVARSRIESGDRSLFTGDPKQDRLGLGIAGPDYSRVAVNGFIGTFYVNYEEELDAGWWAKISFQLESDQQSELVRWLSAPPMLEEFRGGRVAKDFQIYEQLIQAKLFTSTIQVNKFDWDHQKFGLISRSFGSAGTVASLFWDVEGSKLIEQNPKSYDGLPMFSKLHTLGGDSGVMSNYLEAGDGYGSLAVDPANPTQLEFANMLLQCVPHIRTYTWANGVKMNSGAKKFLILCSPNYEGGLNAAITSERLDLGASNPIFGMRQQFTGVISNPYFKNANYIYVVRVDTPNSPFLRTEPDPITMNWQGPGSHYEFEELKYAMGLSCARGLAPGAWESIMRLRVGA